MTVPTTRRATNAFIGSPIERLEDLRFLTGRGQYTDDLTDEKMLHAVILRSSVAHGRIRSIDTAAARARPGVHAVITAADIGEIPTIPLRHDPLPSSMRYVQPIIAADKVRFVGEPIAVVVADSVALAEDALEAIAVDIESLPAVVDRDAARKDDVFLFEETGSNVAGTITATRGDTDAAFKDAPYVRREHFKVQRHGAVPMEPRGLVADWDAAKQRVTVSGVCKVPFNNRRALAQMMKLPEASVRMLEYDVGGGFGARGEFYPEDFLIPFAATRRRPPGEVGRGPAREFDVAQPCARRRMRSRNRLQPRRRPSLRCAATLIPISAPMCAPTAPRRRAIFRKSCPGPIASPMCAWT